MPKQTAKNGIILINGYNFSTYANAYEGTLDVGKIDVTGFGDASQNFILGVPRGNLTVNMFWDTTATTGIHAVLSSLPTGVVSVMPEGNSTSGMTAAPAVTMPFKLANYTPRGQYDGAIELGTLNFELTGPTALGLEQGWLIQHGTVTGTTNGAESLDPLNAAVTAPCTGVLHIWTPTLTDTYVVKIQHATTSGGAYSDLVTFTANGLTRTAERVVVASGTINKYRRISVTRTGAAADPFGFSVIFARGNA